MAYKQTMFYNCMIAKEGTRGTVGTVGHQVPIYRDYSVGFSEDAPTVTPLLRGHAQPSEPGRGNITAGGSVTVPVDESGAIGLWLYTMCPAYTKAGAGDPYTHTFKLGIAGEEPDPFSLEFGNTGVAKYDRYLGCSTTSLEFVAEKTADKVRVVVGVQGMIAAAPILLNAASMDAAPAAYTGLLYNAFGTVAKVGGVASVLIQRMSVRIERAMQAEHVLDGNRYAKAAGFGDIKVSGEITGLADDADTLATYARSNVGAAGTEQQLEIDFIGQSANDDLKLYLPECACYIASPKGPSGEPMDKVSIAFEAYYGNAATNSAAYFELRNAIADYDGAAVWA